MVNKHYQSTKQLDLDGGPPPPDESWWEAVLTEDEAYLPNVPTRPSAPQASAGKGTPPENADELPGVDWKLAESLFADDCVCTLVVNGYNRGGLLVGGPGLQGFVPHVWSGSQPGVLLLRCNSGPQRVQGSRRAVGAEIR